MAVATQDPLRALSSRSKLPGRPLPPTLCSGTLRHFVREGRNGGPCLSHEVGEARSGDCPDAEGAVAVGLLES